MINSYYYYIEIPKIVIISVITNWKYYVAVRCMSREWRKQIGMWRPQEPTHGATFSYLSIYNTIYWFETLRLLIMYVAADILLMITFQMDIFKY